MAKMKMIGVQATHSWKDRVHIFLKKYWPFGFRQKKEILDLKERLISAEKTINSLRQEIAERETEKKNLIWRQNLQLCNLESNNLEKVKGALLKAGKLNFEDMSEEECDKSCNFPVTKEPKSGKWKVSMSICSLGGCEYNDYEFDTKRGAYLFGTVLTQLGAKLDTKSACPVCYAEYMQNCI